MVTRAHTLSGMSLARWLKRQRLEAFVLLWALAGVLAAPLAMSLVGERQAPEESSLAAILFLVLAIAAEKSDLRLHHGDTTTGITLIEAAAAATILLFPSWWALGIILGSIALIRSAQGQEPIKFLFNLGQYSVATSAAITIFHLVRGSSDPFGWMALAGIALGMTAFGVINMLAVDGIVALIEGRSFRTAYREGLRLTAISVLGNTAVGVVAAMLWEARPPYIALLLIPAFTLHLAYRGVVRGDELLKRVASEKERVDRIVDSAYDGIMLIGSDGAVQVWSPTMEKLTGIQASEATGQMARSVFSGRDPSGRVVDPLEPLNSGSLDQPTKVIEMEIVHSKGAEKIVLAHHTVLFDDRGRTTGDVVLIHDVTRQREVERMKDDFIARVSHELRTPLTPIKGWAQSLLLRGDKIPREKQKVALEHIVERSDHMERLIEDLLLVSRISAGRASLSDQVKIQPIDVAAMCDRLLGAFRAVHPSRRFDLNVDGSKIAGADAMRTEQIVANLLSNACKYSNDDSPVTVRVRGDDDSISVTVTDQGRGIPQDQMEQIFEPFHRVEDPMTMTTGGIGIGLYISRQLAEAMDCRLTASSALGKGSSFTLTMPRAD